MPEVASSHLFARFTTKSPGDYRSFYGSKFSSSNREAFKNSAMPILSPWHILCDTLNQSYIKKCYRISFGREIRSVTVILINEIMGGKTGAKIAVSDHIQGINKPKKKPKNEWECFPFGQVISYERLRCVMMKVVFDRASIS
jgi:TPP-dependent indolepyruvate ferredoxin oxidoreductase alpha subunit